ncbi:blood group Rh(CE) polypeptide [Perognathus longimembris pacificus]|uniref:blood group Rh(CE) polypeptide n=1 Tax=Perognathus longimembris pacificus TaxID=214514 RepID=UPI00201970DB|nr:blood group Rh(CE) polypeptide [Perognathus longimembris pacificus]
MGSKYPPSVRCWLPLWALTLEVALILIFAFFTTYDVPSGNQKQILGTYQVLQDFTVMAALGFGFLTTSLRRHGWSSVGFNLFMLALSVQWATLLDAVLEQPFQKKVIISLSRIRLATMSSMSVLISADAVLGKANLVQLMVMALVEMTAFGGTRWISRQIIRVNSHEVTMNIFVFAAYFGLTVSWCLSRALPSGLDKKVQTEKVQMARSSCLFAMLGTLFLWIFWPSFNSALLVKGSERKNAVFNTYYALAVSAVTATSVSALAHPQGKINLIHVHSAMLAGGVAVGPSCHLISSPWLSMVLGLMAGLIAIGAAKCQLVCLNRVLEIQDYSGVHATFGLPGLLGGFAYIVMMAHQVYWNPLIGYQVLTDVGDLCLAVAMGMASGLLTGVILNLKIWRAPHEAKYFDDQTFWEFPHLAVGL